MTQRGVVTRIVQKGKRTGLEISGQWYSLFEPCPVQEGDLVEFDYTAVKRDSKTYYNIGTIRKIEPISSEIDETERIARAVALKAAVASFASLSEEQKPTAQEIVERAEVFLDFLLGERTSS